jgi:long-chain fatty acid transport protein
MKKSFIATGLFGALLASQVFAGGIDAKTNLSVGYIRNPSRNTESERPEAALYNIAGTAFMADGLYIEAGDQFIFKTYSHEMAGTEYKDEKPVFLFPNAEVVYKHGKLGFFGTFQVAAGGGSLEYKDGSVVLAGLNPALATAKPLNIYSVTFGQNLGFSYAINDKVSLSGAVRLLESEQSMEITSAMGKIGYDASGFGVGGIFGVNWRPVENLDLAFQYKTVTKMETEFDSITGNATAQALLASKGIKSGNKFDTDISPEFNFGAGYKFTDALYVSSSFNYYFNKQADMGSALSSTNADYDDSWEIYGGADYAINKKVLVSGGIGYSKQGYNDEYNNVFSPVLDCVSFGAGAEVSPVDNLKLTFGGMYAKYLEEEYNSLKLNKSIIMLSLSATYKFGL